MLTDEETAAEELCRGTLQLLSQLGRGKALTARQKRLLITDVIEHDGEETPAYIVRAYKLLCLNKNGEEVTDTCAREEFVMQCKLEARRLAAVQDRRQASTASRDDSDVDDEGASSSASSDALLE